MGRGVEMEGTRASSSGLPDLNIVGGQSQHAGECYPRICTVSHQRRGPAPLPFLSLYASGGFFASQRSATFGSLVSVSRRRGAGALRPANRRSRLKGA